MSIAKLKSQLSTYDDLQELYEHNKRVSQYSYKLAKLILGDYILIEKIRKAAAFHDIGKLYIDREVLNKNGQLNSREYEVIKKHPEYGYDTLISIGEDREVAEMVRAHHENYDGSGYPMGLKGEDISIGACIIKVCDVFDALNVNRSYRKALSIEESIKIMDNEEEKYHSEVYRVFKENLHLIIK